MANNIEITTRPTPQYLKDQAKAARMKMADMTTPYKKVAVFLDQWVQKNFQSQGGKVGGWVPFADSTLRGIERYDSKRLPAKLLQKTGRLRLSFLPFADSHQAGIGSNLPYAKTHQEGLGHIPQRRLIPYRREVDADVKRILNDHVGLVMGQLRGE